MSIICQKPKLLFLMGPTASGKTALAMDLVDAQPDFELISVDSAMVYQGFNIGSAKPDEDILRRYPHHLIDVMPPTAHYSAANFVSDAQDLIKDIVQRGKTPLLVGGTMMYFNALLKGINELPERDDALRAKLQQRLQEEGHIALHQYLASLCPLTAKRLHPNDSQRLIRAIEVCLLSEQPMAELFKAQECPLKNYRVVQLALEPKERAFLHQRIEKRFHHMLEDGFLEEVEGLLKQGVSLKHASMKSVGYRQVAQYLMGELDKDTMIDKAIAATRALAKRQLTWLRSWPSLTRFECEDENLLRSVKQVIKKK
jgi:tRNA dimethylallyltransferase